MCPRVSFLIFTILFEISSICHRNVLKNNHLQFSVMNGKEVHPGQRDFKLYIYFTSYTLSESDKETSIVVSSAPRCTLLPLSETDFDNILQYIQLLSCLTRSQAKVVKNVLALEHMSVFDSLTFIYIMHFFFLIAYC